MTKTQEERIAVWVAEPDCSLDLATTIVAMEDMETAMDALILATNSAPVMDTSNAVGALKEAEKRIQAITAYIENYPPA